MRPKPDFNSHAVGLAHITGGGIRENLNRILPANVDALIDLEQYRTQPVFGIIRDIGSVSDEEMLRTFNLGVGFAVVCREKDFDNVIETLILAGEEAYRIGKVVNGSGKVRCIGRIKY